MCYDWTHMDRVYLNCRGPHRTLAMACPVKKKAMEAKKTKLKDEREITSGRTFAGVASAIPDRSTKIQLSGGMDQKMLACMLHAHLINMGTPGSYQATLNQLFAANGLTPINIPQNPYSAKFFGILPGGKYPPSNFKINTEINKQKETETLEMEVVQAKENPTATGTPERLVRTRDPRKLKSRHRELTGLCNEEPGFKDGLALRVLSTDRSPRLVNVFKPKAKKDKSQSVLQFHDPRDVNPTLKTDLEGAISEVDVEFLFYEGLLQDDDYDTITVDGEALRKIRPGLTDSFERALVEPSPKVLLVAKE